MNIGICENCGGIMEGYGNNSFMLKPKSPPIRVCNTCDMKEIELRLKQAIKFRKE